MPPRFYCESLTDPSLPDGKCALGPDESRHARKVLRLSEGDAVELFDGRGRLAEAQLVGFDRGAVVCVVLSLRTVTPVGPRLTVAAAVPKGSRAEDMVNQLGQLGVDEFVPLRCARSVVEPSAGKMERYEKAALASAKQSGRPTMMRIAPFAGLDEVLASAKANGDIMLILDPRGGAFPALGETIRRQGGAVVLIGPEGGWTEDELAKAQLRGAKRWRIAEHVLRIETAATASASVLGYLALSSSAER